MSAGDTRASNSAKRKGRLRRSVLLLSTLATAVLISLAIFVGVGISGRGWLAALLLGLAAGVGFLVAGLALARINDRIGELLTVQRTATHSVMASIRSQSAGPVQTAAPAISADTDFAAAHAKLRDLIKIPGSSAGSEHPRQVELRRHPIGVADRSAWIESRGAGPMLELSAAAAAWKSSGLPAATEIPVVTIADEFTFQSFAPELALSRLHPLNWRETMERVQPAVFFCESAWTGGTPPDRPWQGRIYKSVRWAEERRVELLEILAYCRTRGIPTVFWNKEDPVHFSDRINDFVSTASHFDFVFTSAEDCVPMYLRDTPVQHADVLPFAVQPRIFNPLDAATRQDAAVFAGTWYRQYPKRSAAAEQIMDLVVSTGRDLVIFDRMYHTPKNYEYPEKYQAFRHPPIPYEQTADAYRANRFGITLNTITDSRSMFARRVYEMAACGAVVLSNTALGVEHVFGDSVILADREPDRFRELDEAEYRRMRSSALQIALQNTYAHRARTLLAGAGIKTLEVDAPPTLAVTIRSRSEFDDACGQLEAGWFSELLCLVADDAEELLLLDLAQREIPRVTVESRRRIRGGEYRSRSVLGTPHVYLGELGRIPTAAWLRSAQQHLSYSDLPIRWADVPPKNGFLRSVQADTPESSLMTAEQFNTYVCRGSSITSLRTI